MHVQREKIKVSRNLNLHSLVERIQWRTLLKKKKKRFKTILSKCTANSACKLEDAAIPPSLIINNIILTTKGNLTLSQLHDSCDNICTKNNEQVVFLFGYLHAFGSGKIQKKVKIARICDASGRICEGKTIRAIQQKFPVHVHCGQTYRARVLTDVLFFASVVRHVQPSKLNKFTQDLVPIWQILTRLELKRSACCATRLPAIETHRVT